MFFRIHLVRVSTGSRYTCSRPSPLLVEKLSGNVDGVEDVGGVSALGEQEGARKRADDDGDDPADDGLHQYHAVEPPGPFEEGDGGGGPNLW